MSTPAASASISWDVTVGSTITSPLSVPVGDGRAVLDRSQIGASLPTHLTIRVTNQHGSDELVASVLLGDRIVDPYLAALAQCSAVATVQLGWDAIAASNSGGVLLLRPGSHVGAGNCGAQLTTSSTVASATLRGLTRTATDTVIECGGGQSGERVLFVDVTGSVSMEYLSLRGAALDNDDGGGVHVAGGVVSLVACELSGHSARRGGGLYASGSATIVNAFNTTIENNTATTGGGFMRLEMRLFGWMVRLS